MTTTQPVSLSERKHTPGPWGRNPNSTNDSAVTARNVGCVTGGEWQLNLCLVFADGNIGHKQAEANAHLIAAAPDMYEALKHCLGVLCESGNLNNYRNLSDAELGKVWVETAKEATAALARAEGRSP